MSATDFALEMSPAVSILKGATADRGALTALARAFMRREAPGQAGVGRVMKEATPQGGGVSRSMELLDRLGQVVGRADYVRTPEGRVGFPAMGLLEPGTGRIADMVEGANNVSVGTGTMKEFVRSLLAHAKPEPGQSITFGRGSGASQKAIFDQYAKRARARMSGQTLKDPTHKVFKASEKGMKRIKKVID